jgi:hypothetical protein
MGSMFKVLAVSQPSLTSLAGLGDQEQAQLVRAELP